MPKIKVQATKTVTLTLTEEEALWLKEAMQNPLGGQASEEPTECCTMRRAYWEALKDV
jgi:hypothetical protein